MKSLVVGLGIGRLYVDVLKRMGADVVTVDLDQSKNPNFTDFTEACNSNKFDTVHICTPNFTHENLFYDYVKSAPKTNSIVFVEKPGFKTAQQWQSATESNVRLMMVKNNQYRSNISDMVSDANKSNYIKLSWINYNRVPNPGSWFTTKDLAWGGVSRDLMPHLLSYLPVLLADDFRDCEIMRKLVSQRSKLKEMTSSDYGNVDAAGTYNVDDYCALELTTKSTRMLLIADWRSMREEDVSISFGNNSVYELGLCPEEAYSTMISTALHNKNDEEFWAKQRSQDIWIHKILEVLHE